MKFGKKIINMLMLILILALPTAAIAFSLSDFFGTNTPTTLSEPDSKTVKKFNDSYKLIFIYTSTCGYCHKFAPVLAEFVKDYALNIESLTANGGKIAGFTNAKHDEKRIEDFNIRYFPAVIVQNKNNVNDTYVLASGYLSKTELNDKFSNLLNEIY